MIFARTRENDYGASIATVAEASETHRHHFLQPNRFALTHRGCVMALLIAKMAPTKPIAFVPTVSFNAVDVYLVRAVLLTLFTAYQELT